MSDIPSSASKSDPTSHAAPALSSGPAATTARQSRKQIIEQYKQRQVIGGVFQIRNTNTGKIYVDASVDLAGSQNRFAFAQSTGSAIVYKLQRDWAAQGADTFTFEILEEISKDENQSDAEFKADVKALKEIWLEKLAGADMY